MDTPTLPWEKPEIMAIIEDFRGHVAEIKQIDIVIIKENNDGTSGDIHG